MKLKVKKLHPNAVIPYYSKPGDAAIDLTAVRKEYDSHGNIIYWFGLALEIEEGYFALIAPRSSNCFTDLILTNSVGIIDSGFRGEISAKFGTYRRRREESLSPDPEYYTKEHHVFERVAQMLILPYPKIEVEEADELSDTERGSGGYGHTGK